MPRDVQEYSAFTEEFRLEDITGLLSGDLETGLNVCVECCDRWAETDSIALYWEGADGSSSTHGFAELQEGAARFANLLTAQGVRPGDQVACMLPRIPDLFVVALGVWRAGAVYVPLFTAMLQLFWHYCAATLPLVYRYVIFMCRYLPLDVYQKQSLQKSFYLIF